MDVRSVTDTGVEQHGVEALEALLERDDGFVWVDRASPGGVAKTASASCAGPSSRLSSRCTRERGCSTRRGLNASDTSPRNRVWPLRNRAGSVTAVTAGNRHGMKVSLASCPPPVRRTRW